MSTYNFKDSKQTKNKYSGNRLSKYFYMYRLGFLTNLANRGQVMIWILVSSSSTFVMLFTWLIVTTASGNTGVGSFTNAQLIIYYLFLQISWYVIGGTFWHMMEEQITSGKLANQLSKPIFPYSYSIMMEQGWKTVGLILSIFTLLFVIIILSGFFDLSFNVFPFFMAIPAMFFGAILFAEIQFFVGNLGHWLSKSSGVANLTEQLMYIFGGMLAPLSLMPQIIFNIAEFLPFRYLFSFPVEIILGQIYGLQISLAYLVQISWIVLLAVSNYFFYHWGLKKYESFGN